MGARQRQCGPHVFAVSLFDRPALRPSQTWGAERPLARAADRAARREGGIGRSRV